MGPQEVCLVSQNMGHEHMHIFDRLHPRVRERLRDANQNLCLACLEMHAGRDPRRQMEMINQIEEGRFDVRFFGDPAGRGYAPERGYREEERLRRLYEPAFYPSPDFYDPGRRAPRDFGDAFERGVQLRIPDWSREYRYEPLQVDIRSARAAAWLDLRAALIADERAK